jgi:flagellar biosynthesis protein FliQ
MIFPTVLDNDYDGYDGPSSHKRDISDALQDLGELGFVAGYCGAQIFFSKLVCDNLVGLGISCEQSSTALNELTLIFVMLWMLCTKMRDYIKVVERMTRYVDCSDLVACEFVQAV